MKVSWLVITYNRFGLTNECIEKAIERVGMVDYELLIGDNNSTEEKLVDWIKSIKPTQFLRSEENLGEAKMMNQLLLRKSEDSGLIVTTGNDIELPNNWMLEMLHYTLKVSSTGFCSIHCVESLPPIVKLDGFDVHLSHGGVFGPTMWTNRVFEEIGFFCEDYGLYGPIDWDYSLRNIFAGYSNYYIPGLKAMHLGTGKWDEGEYRTKKNELIYGKEVEAKYISNIEKYRQGAYFIPAPERKELCHYMQKGQDGVR